MDNTDIKRVSRLTAIITQLQTKKLLTATQLALKFNVSVRTIYRDIRALEEAGVPILTEEGKGYMLMEDYRVPPVMFTEAEANALITAEQLMLKNSDSSLRREYAAAAAKIRSVLRYTTKEKAELLSQRIALSPAITPAPVSHSLALVQGALTTFHVLEITYQARGTGEITEREVEPFAFYYSLQESWLLIAYCRLRKDFRMFRLDRISHMKMLDTVFEPHELTLAAYLAEKQKKFTTPDIPLS